MSTGFQTRVTGLEVSERFKGFFDVGYSIRPTRKTFFLGEHGWAARCKHYSKVYERHALAKQGLLTLAGQLTSDGIFLEAAGDHDRAQEALKKCEDLNRQIKLPLLVRRTGYYMGKFGSCFWEKTWTPHFDTRLIPMQECVEPAEQNIEGDIVRWRENLHGREGATWNVDEIVPFHWDVTMESWPYGTSLYVGLDSEFETLEHLQQNTADFMEKQAWPYEMLQIGDSDYRPTDAEMDTVESKWKHRQVGENLITSYPAELKQGGTGEHPIQALDKLLHFSKENIIDGVMVPPISKQWSSTEASAKEMMPWARANIIQPMQQIIAFIIEDEIYKPYLIDLGYSVKICPKILWEAPDAHKDEEAEYYSMLVQTGIIPPEVAAEEMGFDMDKIKKYNEERLRQQIEQQQLSKIEPVPKQATPKQLANTKRQLTEELNSNAEPEIKREIEPIVIQKPEKEYDRILRLWRESKKSDE